MPISDKDVDDLQSGITNLAHAEPLVAAGDALGSLGQHILDAKDALTKHARALTDDLSSRFQRAFSTTPDVSSGARDIELPRDPKTARTPSKAITRPRTLAGGKR